jgi:hypothetical protein
VNDRSTEFGAGWHVHDRIIDAVEHEQVPQMTVDIDSRVRAVGFEPDTPVEGHDVTWHGKSAQPKRQNVDGHVESGSDFKSIDFRAHWHPRKTLGVELVDVRSHLSISETWPNRVFIKSNGRILRKCDDDSLSSCWCWRFFSSSYE